MVMADGGFRRGADIIKAVALGADMAFVGRPLLYGISAGGEAGAIHALKILLSEIDRVLALDWDLFDRRTHAGSVMASGFCAGAGPPLTS